MLQGHTTLSGLLIIYQFLLHLCYHDENVDLDLDSMPGLQTVLVPSNLNPTYQLCQKQTYP